MSLAQRVYGATPVWFQNAMLSGYGVLLRSRRYGGVHREVLTTLVENERKSADELAQIQLASLNRTLGWAAGLPLYRGKRLPARVATLEELVALPLLAKDELRRPAEDVVGDRARGAIVIHTGGTTGTPLSVYCNRTALQRNYAFFERFRRVAGIHPDDRVATFAGRTIIPNRQDRPPYWRHNRASHAMLFSSYHISETTLPDYVRALERFAPALIDSYPSNLDILSRYMLRERITSVRPTAIITSSETLFAVTRQNIEDAFGCRVFDQYGSAEMAAFISQCEHGSYHVNPDFGIVEIIGDAGPAADGESGEIVATSFVNPVMPLIRYRTGDRAVASSSGCACGRAFPVVARIEGRMDDSIVTPEGFTVGRLDPIFKAVHSIVETRIVQDHVDRVRIEIVPAADYVDSVGAVLVEELRKRVGPSMHIELCKVESIPRTRGGKLRMVVNNVKRSAPSTGTPNQ